MSVAPVPVLRARTYHGKMDAGVNTPAKVYCVGEDGQEGTYIVKSHGMIGNGSVCELMAALLGQCLGLSVPPVAIIDVPFLFLSQIPDAEMAKRLSPGMHFGSLYLERLTPFTTGQSLPASWLEGALNVFAFDMLIQNPDRLDRDLSGGGKENLLVREGQFILIDHEKAFSFLHAIGPVPHPWELRGLPFARCHLLRCELARHTQNGVCFDGFLNRLQCLSDPVLAAIVNTVPDSWDTMESRSRIADHIHAVRDDVARFDRGLREVLA